MDGNELHMGLFKVLQTGLVDTWAGHKLIDRHYWLILGTEGIIGGSLVPPGLNLDIFLLKVVPPLHPGYVWEGVCSWGW